MHKHVTRWHIAMRVVSLLCSAALAAALTGCVDAYPTAPVADQSMAEMPAEDSPPPPDQPQQRDQIVAPIAFYPDACRSSGVRRFIAGEEDVVYEKDLGLATAKLARAITDGNADPTWADSAP